MTKGESFAHVHITKHISEKILLSPKTPNNSYHFPLYIYPTENEIRLFAGNSRKKLKPIPNFNPDFIHHFSKLLNLKFITQGPGDLKNNFGPEDIFYYFYALLHSSNYRNRYSEFLTREFPRLPLTKNKKLFTRLCSIGAALSLIHLMKKDCPSILTYPISGNNIVLKIKYVLPANGNPKGRVYINEDQYFEGMSQDVWNNYIGGYQVCHKWLKRPKRH